MKNYQNYKRGYYMPPVQCTDWVNSLSGSVSRR